MARTKKAVDREAPASRPSGSIPLIPNASRNVRGRQPTRYVEEPEVQYISDDEMEVDENTAPPLYEPPYAATMEDAANIRSAHPKHLKVMLPTPTSSFPPNLPTLDAIRTTMDLQTSRASVDLVPKPPTLPGRRLGVENDPINHLIKLLRQQYSMPWSLIAQYCNSELIKAGEKPTLTQPAVYSRFVRNSPKIAEHQSEMDFNPKDFMYIRNPHYYPYMEGAIGPFIKAQQGNAQPRKQPTEPRSFSIPMPATDFSTPNVLSDPNKHYTIRKEMKNGNIRRTVEKSVAMEELKGEELTVALIRAVETVEDGFWSTVSNEMDRECGARYSPEDLKWRYAELSRELREERQ